MIKKSKVLDLSRGIMLEGVSCSGKTSTMYALKRLFATDLTLERNIIMLGEHYSQVLNSVNGELRNHEYSEHTEMLFKRVEMLEQLHEWACYLGGYNRTSRGLYTVFERGLLNHTAFYKDYKSPQIKELERRFAKLGIKEILLVVSDGLIEERVRLRSEQLKEQRSEAYFRELAENHKKQQNSMLASAEKMSLPCRIICTDSMEWDKYARMIICNKD